MVTVGDSLNSKSFKVEGRGVQSLADDYASEFKDWLPNNYHVSKVVSFALRWCKVESMLERDLQDYSLKTLMFCSPAN